MRSKCCWMIPLRTPSLPSSWRPQRRISKGQCVSKWCIGNVSHFYKKVCCCVPSQRGNWLLGVVHTPEVINSRLAFKVCVRERETDRESVKRKHSITLKHTQCATHKHPHRRKDSFFQNVQCAEEFFTLAPPTDKPPVSYPLTSP